MIYKKIMLKEFLQPANLVSLSRILLLFPAAYFLMQTDNRSTIYCLIIVFVAGLTDGLDGYLARRLNQVSRLGIALDPIADKIFVGGLAIMVVFYRDFPVWLATLVIGRDLLIMLSAGLLMRGTKITLPSNLTGKYAFSCLMALLFSHIIRFEFGIMLYTITSVMLLLASSVNYGRIFVQVKRGETPKPFNDKPIYSTIRGVGTCLIIAVYLAVWLTENL